MSLAAVSAGNQRKHASNASKSVAKPKLLSSADSKASKAHTRRMAFACSAGCAAREPQLEKSLAPWADWKKKSTGLEMIDSLEGFCNAQRSSEDPFIIAVLWKNDVYLKTCDASSLKSPGLYLIGPEDLSLVLTFLLHTQRMAELPAGPIAFGMYLSDYTSLVDRHLIGPGLPIFSYLGRDTSWAVPWPSSFTVMSSSEAEEWQERQESASDKEKSIVQKTWEQRESKAYWIGTVTGPWEFALDSGLDAVPRLKMLKLASENQEQLRADWSKTAGYGISWVHDNDKIGGFGAHQARDVQEMTGIAKAGYQDVDTWQNYKYFVNLDGVVLGGRLPKLLRLGGVVLQQEAGYTEHISGLLKPYEHYVPVEYDLSDLVAKVKWLQQNATEAKRIAENARNVAKNRMRIEDHLCYIWRALEALGTKTAAAKSADMEVEKRLASFNRVSMHEGGMRGTLERFWNSKLEEVATGERVMSDEGIEFLQRIWDRLEGIHKRTQTFM